MQARALLLAALTALALAQEPPAAPCPARCDVSRCPSPHCPGGYTPDRCKCCLVCAGTEGEACGRPLDAPCGESLECRRGACRCRWAQPVCGNDGSTYANLCALLAASRRALQLSRPPVRQLHKGACSSGKRRRDGDGERDTPEWLGPWEKRPVCFDLFGVPLRRCLPWSALRAWGGIVLTGQLPGGAFGEGTLGHPGQRRDGP